MSDLHIHVGHSTPLNHSHGALWVNAAHLRAQPGGSGQRCVGVNSDCGLRSASVTCVCSKKRLDQEECGGRVKQYCPQDLQLRLSEASAQIEYPMGT